MCGSGVVSNVTVGECYCQDVITKNVPRAHTHLHTHKHTRRTHTRTDTRRHTNTEVNYLPTLADVLPKTNTA